MPPGFTVRSPPTKVKVELTTRLKRRFPLIVVLLAVAPPVSTVTVVPKITLTGLQALGDTPESHVLPFDQFPFATELKVEQPTGDQMILLPVSLNSLASPTSVPEYR